MKQNAFLAKVEARIQREKMYTQRWTRQLMGDIFAIALNSELGLGAERLEAVNLKVAALFDEYAGDWNKEINDTDDAEAARDILDKKLKQIYGAKFVPWEERYEGMKP
jgi:hypothetical protein